MEKKNIKLSEPFKLNELMIKGKIKPDCSVCSAIQIKGNILEIELEQSLNNPENIFIGFYSESLTGCYAVCAGYVLTKNKIAFNFDENIMTLLSASGVSYYRMCIAVEYQSEYSCFYAQSKNYVPASDLVDYRGALITSDNSESTLAAYFSKGGRLSAKIIGTKQFFKDFYSAEVISVKRHKNGLELGIICRSDDIQTVEPYLVSRDGKNIIPLISSLNEYDILTSYFEFGSLEGCDFTRYILKVNVKGISVDTKWSKQLNVEGCSLYDNMTFCINGENHSISCGNSADTFEFDYIDKYYSSVISVIVAVYNTESFVADAIESVLAQDIKPIVQAVANDKTTVYDNIYELILVDDGSTDSSGDICDKYAEKYPQIKVIHKENGGVSSARNAGIEVAGGKYLNFLDSDDKFSPNVFKDCFVFFEKHYYSTDIITFPIKFFDGSTGDHWLNFKFSDGNRIVDYNKEYDKPLLFVNASFFKGDVVRKGIRFDEELRTGEDIKFIYSIIFNSIAKIGVLNPCTYWYRRRTSGESSAIQAAKTTKEHYISKVQNLLNWTIDYSKQNFGIIPRYVQYLVAQDLQWRFIQDGDAAIAREVLSDEEFKEYKDNLIKLLECVDADIIMEQKKIWREQKMYMLKLKYHSEPEKYFVNNDIYYYFDGMEICNASTCYWRIDFLKIENGNLYIEGYNMSFEKEQNIYISVNGEYIKPEIINRNMCIYSLGDEIFFSHCFKFIYELDPDIDKYEIEFDELINGHYVTKRELRFGKFASISQKYKKSYYMSKNWVARMKDSTLIIDNISNTNSSIISSLKTAANYEKEFIDEIVHSRDYRRQEVKNALELRKKIMPLKSLYNQMPHKKIWLVSDRINMAGDNGEALFIYLNNINDPDIDVYFVIGDDCEDYERMKQYGKVLVQNSQEHIMIHLLADYIVSSQALEYIFNPFSSSKTTDIFKDILTGQKFIFLQHGIIKDDLSDWTNKYNKNISGFVTAAMPEYQSILDYNYYYSEKEAWLTGLPRHDRLYNDTKKYITVMPTWRKYLSKDVDEGVTTVSDDFVQSDYFNFYNALLNNSKLLDAAKEYGYTICFRPHPYIMDSLNEFQHNENVIFFEKEKPYREVYAESDLVITDYSSSVMDFAYLRKPIVYCQFDRDEFFSGKHTYVEGYYDYEKDGFGELTFDMDSLVEVVIEYMKNGCILKDMYRDRIDNFLAFNDKDNCARVYRKIKDL